MPDAPRFVVECFVPGKPVAQPRPRAVRAGAHARVYNPGTADAWKAAVIHTLAGRRGNTLHGPVDVIIRCEFARPKSHYRKSGTLTTAATLAHLGRPDVDNLAKAVLDACTTAGVWKDDAQVTQLAVEKRWAEPGCPEGCYLHILQADARG